MIYWATKPGKVLIQIVSNALDEIIEWVENERDDHNVLYISQDLVDSLGGSSGVEMFAKRIKAAHEDPRMLQISDYMYRFLYELLHSWTDCYNDTLAMGYEEELLTIDGVRIEHVDFEYIVDARFWDLDFQFPPKLAESLGKYENGMADVSNSAVNASLGRTVDSADMEVTHMDHVDVWTEFTVQEDADMINHALEKN